MTDQATVHSSYVRLRSKHVRTRWALALMCLYVAGACGDDDGSQLDAAQRDTNVSADTNIDAPDEGVFVVDFDTTAGTFAVEVHSDWSPNGAAHFRELVESGYYNDQRIFRVIPGFVAQWGISGTPEDHETRTIADDPVIESNTQGTLSFAKTPEPNSRASQVFINFTDNAFLDEMGFSPFGRVVEGLSTIDAFNGEYGDTPVQAQAVAEGNAYLDVSFPNLTQIRTATIR